MATKNAKVNVETSKNSVKVTEKKTGKVVTYLNEGITGKALMNLRILANAEHKKDGKSFSFCLKRAIEFGSEYFAAIRDFDAKDLTPANLIPLRSERDAKREGFSVWEVYGLIKKFYAAKDEAKKAAEKAAPKAKAKAKAAPKATTTKVTKATAPKAPKAPKANKAATAAA